MRINPGRQIVGFCAIFLVVNLLSACSAVIKDTPQELVEKNPTPGIDSSAIVFPLVPPDPTVGKQLFLQNCSECHGNLSIPPANETFTPLRVIDQKTIEKAKPSDWYKVISNGVSSSGMHAFTSLTTQERWDILSYLFLNQTIDGNSQNASLVYENLCQSCHGDMGKGDGEQAVTQALNMPDWSNQELLAEKSITKLAEAIRDGTQNGMPKFAVMLSEKEIRSLAEYIRIFSINQSAISSIIKNQTSIINTIQNIPTPFIFNITGKITNGSSGMDLTDQIVVLRIYSDGVMIEEKSTKAGTKGLYHFDSLPWNALWTYQVSSQYKGIIYPSRMLEAIGITANDVIDLPLVIYEKTTEQGSLESERLKVKLDFSSDGWIQVSESMLLSNPSRLTIVPADEDHPVVDFHLPAGFFGLSYNETNAMERYQETRNGVGDWEPVLPGMSHQILLEYTLPFHNYRLIDLGIPMATDSVMIVVVDPAGEVNCNAAQMTAVQSTSSDEGNAFTIQNFDSKDDLLIECSSRQTILAGTVILIVLVGMVIVIGGWSFLNTKQRSQKKKVNTVAMLKQEKEAVLDQIIALDDRFKAGELNIEVYHAKRAEFVRQVEEIERHT